MGFKSCDETVIIMILTIFNTFWATNMQVKPSPEDWKLFKKHLGPTQSWFVHLEGGVCKFGRTAGLVITIGMIAQLVSLIVYNDDKKVRRKIGIATIISTTIFAIMMLFMNSFLAHYLKGYYSIGLFEYAIPSIALQYLNAYLLMK